MVGVRQSEIMLVVCVSNQRLFQWFVSAIRDYVSSLCRAIRDYASGLCQQSEIMTVVCVR